MEVNVHDTLSAWGDFYLITGSAAAALTGLQFVVQTLIAADSGGAMAGDDPEGGIAAFGTPTVVHFALAMLVSAVLCAPWPGYASLHITLGVIGAGALIYSAIVLRRARRQRTYVPTVDDWVWHIVLPAVAYAAIMSSGIAIAPGGVAATFLVAAAIMLLLCVGIHNAWDTVTYLTVIAIRARRPADTLVRAEGSAASRATIANPGVTVRAATEADLSAVGRLGALLVRTHHDFDPRRFIAATTETADGYASFLGTQLKDPKVVVLVAERGGRVVGYAYAGLEGRDWMTLREDAGAVYDVVVDPAHRGQGIGRKLLDASLRALKEKGAPRVVLSTAERNVVAQRLFAGAGFRRTMIEMTREL